MARFSRQIATHKKPFNFAVVYPTFSYRIAKTTFSFPDFLDRGLALGMSEMNLALTLLPKFLQTKDF